MLRAWDLGFAYNNRCHSSIEMAHVEVFFYWSKYRSDVNWFKLGKIGLVGPNRVQDAQTKVCVI